MVHKKKMAIAAGVMLPALIFSDQLLATTNEELSAKIQMLESQLSQLQVLVTEQGQKQQEFDTVVSKKADASTSGTTFSYGGFVKFDAMHSDYSGGERALAGIGDDILVPSTIPVGGEDGSTRFDTSVKTSRFWFKTKTPTDMGDVRTHIELDMLTADGDERISNSSHSRIRHAYLAWDYEENSSLLVGQSWSTFMSTAVLPEAVDFIGPTSGVVFNRQAQVRWSHQFDDGGKLHLALENPSTSIFDEDFVDEDDDRSNNNYDDNSIPDVVIRYDGRVGNFIYNVAAIGRQITYDTGTEDEDKFGFGTSLSGKYTFGNSDDVKLQFNHGHLGRYVGLQAFRDSSLDVDGDLDLVEITGGFVAYRHLWSPKFRSTFSYAMSSADNSSDIPDTNTEEVSNYSANLFYSPTEKLSFGVELMKAERELENGDDDNLRRLQLTGKYVF